MDEVPFIVPIAKSKISLPILDLTDSVQSGCALKIVPSTNLQIVVFELLRLPTEILNKVSLKIFRILYRIDGLQTKDIYSLA